MTRNTHSNRFVSWGSLVLVILAGNVVNAAELTAATPRVIEVFTSSDLSITGGAVTNSAPGRPTSDLQIYNLDGIQSIETKLSIGLTADPEQSKRVVLQRFQQLHDDDRAQMQYAAMGLAKAVQYGIDRYPAIVFDGQVVVYGLTDLEVALQHYRAWRTGNQP
jgi:integrating conjugative element protein (TIGR03757 family)